MADHKDTYENVSSCLETSCFACINTIKENIYGQNDPDCHSKYHKSEGDHPTRRYVLGYDGDVEAWLLVIAVEHLQRIQYEVDCRRAVACSDD